MKTTDASWTCLVRNFRKVWNEVIARAIAKQREAAGEGCRNDPHRNTWCTCCP